MENLNEPMLDSLAPDENLPLDDSDQVWPQILLPTINESICGKEEAEAATLDHQTEPDVKRQKNADEVQPEHREELAAQELMGMFGGGELEDIQMSRLRECDASTLRKLIQFGTEMAAREKAKEEILITSMKAEQERTQREHRQLDDDIAYLLETENNLKQQLQNEELREEQLRKELTDAVNIFQILKENLDGFREAHGVISSETVNLEHEQNLTISNYHAKKAEISEQIAKERGEIKQIEEEWKAQKKEYAEKIERLKRAIEEQDVVNLNWEKRIEEQKMVQEEGEREISRKKKVLKNLEDEEKRLLDEIKLLDADILVLNEEKKEKELANERYLKEKKAELDESLERSKQLEEEKQLLNKKLENEVEKTKQLEKEYEEVEENHHKLLDRKKELETNIQTLKGNKKVEAEELEESIKMVDGDIKKIKEDTINIIKEKNEAINTFQQMQESHLFVKAEIARVKESSKKLREANEYYLCKAVEDEKKIADLQNKIIQHKEKIQKEEQAHEKEYEQKLDSITKILDQRKRELEITMAEAAAKEGLLEKELENYKLNIDKALKINKENKDRILQQLKMDIEKTTIESNEKLKAIENIKVLIKKKKEESENLKKTLDSMRLVEEEKKEEGVVRPAGILKSPGTKTSPKNVTWRIPSTSTISSDSSVAGSSKNVHNESQEDVFN